MQSSQLELVRLEKFFGWRFKGLFTLHNLHEFVQVFIESLNLLSAMFKFKMIFLCFDLVFKALTNNLNHFILSLIKELQLLILGQLLLSESLKALCCLQVTDVCVLI